jgi:beta-glucanase (GH16 family)
MKQAIQIFSFIVLVAMAAACHPVSKTGSSKNELQKNPVIAHRGAFKKNGFPENSIAALKEAIRLGCTGSEFDIRMTADDSLIINHDPHYNKLEIEKETYNTLTQFKLSNGEKLPTLREYLLAGLTNNKSTKLICEIKPSATKERAKRIATKVVQLVQQLKAKNKVAYISFDIDILKQVLQEDRKANTQYLNGDLSPEQLHQLGVKGADYHYTVFAQKPEWISAAKKIGIELNAWTVNTATDMDWLLANNFQYITTNEPELLFEKAAASPIAQGWQLSWSDEFNIAGPPDNSKWKYDTGGHGWGNNEWQYYTHADTNNAFVKEGKLHITALKKSVEKNNYTSAKLITKERQLFTYGRIEISAKLPSGRGTWPAIWMLGNNIDTAGWPLCGEIDIMEHVGFNKDSVFGSVHTQLFNHIIGTQTTKGLFIQNPYTAFHVYGIEWSPEKIDFFIDGNKYLSFKNQHLSVKEWPFDKPFYLILNVAVGGNWGGQQGVDETVFPATMEVDYVRVYQR